PRRGRAHAAVERPRQVGWLPLRAEGARVGIMTAIAFLLPFALVLGGVLAVLFMLASRAGPFDVLRDPPEPVLPLRPATLPVIGPPEAPWIRAVARPAATRARLPRARARPARRSGRPGDARSGLPRRPV